MATDAPNGQSYGVVNIATGGFTGAGEAVEVTLGFVPRRVELINVTDRIQHHWHADMAATTTLNIAADGTATANTSSHITAEDPANSGTFRGFNVAAGAAVSAKVYVWTAWG
jgi:hypothetical protein